MANCYDCKSAEWKTTKSCDGISNDMFDGCRKNLIITDGECEGFERLKTVQVIIRMCVDVTDEEYSKLYDEASAKLKKGCSIFNADIPDWLMEKIKKKGRIDAGSYIPALFFDD